MILKVLFSISTTSSSYLFLKATIILTDQVTTTKQIWRIILLLAYEIF